MADVETAVHDDAPAKIEEKEPVKEASEKDPTVTENGHPETPEEAPKIEEKVSDAETKDTSSADDKVASVSEEPKEEPVPKVILHQFPPAKSIPSLSPFCLKLETFLRLNKIPYENQYGYKMGKNGKMPWIEYKGERKSDSSFIIDYLKEKFELDIDADLSDADKALGRVVKVTLEENTSLVTRYLRFIDNGVEFRKLVAPASAGIGFNVQFKMLTRKVKNTLDAHGISRHTKEEVYKVAEEDIAAVSVLLGEKEFLLGSTPTSYDCTVFGIIANCIWSGLESPMCKYVNENATNLVKFCERMKELSWPDWSEMVLGDKPEPSLKKGFSFRRKKAPKPAKAQDDETEEKNKPKEETKAEDESKKEENDDSKAEESTTPTKPEGDDVTTNIDKHEEPTENGGASAIKTEE